MTLPLRSEGGEGERPGEWMGWGFCGFFLVIHEKKQEDMTHTWTFVMIL